MSSSRTPLVIIFHGPSGVGKESVIEGVQAATGIHRATSTTDRPPRPGERDGIDYHFVSTAEFEARIAAGEFAEYARVYDDWKGLERREIEGPVERGEDVIIRTDVQGARRWRELVDGAVSVVIVAAAPEEPAETHRSLTRDRILGREPGIAADSLARRLAEVAEELADVPHNDHVVVNRDGGLGDAVAQMLSIIESERENPRRAIPRLRDATHV